jgi:antitoxin component HigA of HigAB toxin-antitoxin module
MLVVVKKPHIEIKGVEKPEKLISFLEKDYGKENVIIDEEDWINITETEWYKKTKASMGPKDHMKAYRHSRGWSQDELVKRLGGFSRQRVSDIESGRRPITLEVAKKLVEIFGVSIEKFV